MSQRPRAAPCAIAIVGQIGADNSCGGTDGLWIHGGTAAAGKLRSSKIEDGLPKASRWPAAGKLRSSADGPSRGGRLARSTNGYLMAAVGTPVVCQVQGDIRTALNGRLPDGRSRQVAS